MKSSDLLPHESHRDGAQDQKCDADVDRPQDVVRGHHSARQSTCLAADVPAKLGHILLEAFILGRLASVLQFLGCIPYGLPVLGINRFFQSLHGSNNSRLTLVLCRLHQFVDDGQVFSDKAD